MSTDARARGPAAERGFGRDFRRFLAAQTISSFGSSFTMFALPLLVFELTGSALDLGLAVVAEYLPYLLFGPFIGVLVDRMDRKKLMVFSDVAQTVVISAVPLLAAFGSLSVGFVYAAGFLSSTLWIFFNTAEFAAVPSLVPKEDLTAANGRLQASYAAASIARPLLAGLLAATVPIASIFYFDAASFLLSALLVASTRASFKAEEKTPPDGGLLRGAVEGVRYVLGHPVLRSISLMMALANCVGYTVYAELVLFAKERLEASDFQVGLLYAAGGAGMVLLALAASPLKRRLPFGVLTLGAIGLGGALILLLSLTRSYPVAAVLWTAIWGVLALFQISTPSGRRPCRPTSWAACRAPSRRSPGRPSL